MKHRKIIIHTNYISIDKISCHQKGYDNEKNIGSFLAFATLILAACSNNEPKSDKTIEKLFIAFAPTRDVEEILIAADPLKDILKSKLEEKGFTVENIDVAVGIDQNVPAEALISGPMDISILPAPVFAQYRKEGINLLVETLNHGVGDSEGKVIEPEEGITPWNSGITTDAKELVGGNISLIYVNIATEKGARLYEKAINGSLIWDDLNSAKWCVRSSDSYDGYIYPSLWINDNFSEGAGSAKKTVADLKDAIPNSYYNDMISALFESNADVIVGYADLRKDKSAIGQFEKVFADKIADGKKNSKMTPEFVVALQE